MRGFLLLLCLVGGVYANEEADYKSSVLILKDGRMIAIRGDMEIIGEEVQFMFSDGKLMTLPLSKIDLDATRKKQAEIAEKAAQEASKVRSGGDDTYDRIREYQAQNPPDESKPVQEPAPRRVFEKKEKKRKVLDIDSSTLENLNQEQVERYLEEVSNHFEQLSATKMWLFGGLAVLMLVGALISIILRIYLLWTSRYQSMIWTLSLATATFAPICYSFLASFIPDESVFKMLVGLFIAGLQIIEPFLYGAYILIHCIGKRLLFLFLLFWPVLVAIALVVVLIVFKFPLPTM